MADSLFDNRYRYDYIYPRGRSGETLRAIDTLDNNRLVVIKRPAPNDAPPIRAGQEVSIVNERKALTRLAGHQVLTTLVGSGQFFVGGLPHQYIAIERGSGHIVADLVIELASQGQRLPELEMLMIVDALLDLITAAHAHDIVYNDVDAKHLFWDRDLYRLKVIDWGNAVFLEGDEITPQGISRQSDIYQVGELLYFILTGGERAEIPRDAADDFTLDFHTDSDRVSPRLQAIISKAAHPNIKLRYRSIADLRRDLTEYRMPLERERDMIVGRINERLRRSLSKDELNGLINLLEPALEQDSGYPAGRKARKEITDRLNDLEVGADIDAVRIYMQSGSWGRASDLLVELRERARGDTQALIILLIDWTTILDEHGHFGAKQLLVVQEALIAIFERDFARAADILLTRITPETRTLHYLLAEQISAYVLDVVLLRPNLYVVELTLNKLADASVAGFAEPRALLGEIYSVLDALANTSTAVMGELRDGYRAVVDQLTALTALCDSIELPQDWSALERAMIAAMALADHMHVIGKRATSSPRDATDALDGSRAIDPQNPAWDAIARLLDGLYELLQSYQTYIPAADGSDLEQWFKESRRDLAPFIDRLFDELLAGMVDGLDIGARAWATYGESSVLGNRVGAVTALAQATDAVATISPTLAGWLNQLRTVVTSAHYIERHALHGGLGRALADGWEAFDRGRLQDSERLGQQAYEIAHNEAERFAARRLRNLAAAAYTWSERGGVNSAKMSQGALVQVEELYAPDENAVRQNFAAQMPSKETYLKAMQKGLVELYGRSSSAAVRILFFNSVLNGTLDAHDGSLEDSQFWREVAARALGDTGARHILTRTLDEFIARRRDVGIATKIINSISQPEALLTLEPTRRQIEDNPQARILGGAVQSLRELEGALRDWSDGEFRAAGIKLENALNGINEAEQSAGATFTAYRAFLMTAGRFAAELYTVNRQMKQVIERRPAEPSEIVREAHQRQAEVTSQVLGERFAATLRQWHETYLSFLAVYTDNTLRRSMKLTRLNELFRAMFIDRHPAYPLYRLWYEVTERSPEFPAPPTDEPTPRIKENEDIPPDEYRGTRYAEPEVDAPQVTFGERLRRIPRAVWILIPVLLIALIAGGIALTSVLNPPTAATTTPTESTIALNPADAGQTSTAIIAAATGTRRAQLTATAEGAVPATLESFRTPTVVPTVIPTRITVTSVVEATITDTPVPEPTDTLTATFTPSNTPTPTPTLTPTLPPTGLQGEQDVLGMFSRIFPEEIFWDTEQFDLIADNDGTNYWRIGRGDDGEGVITITLSPDLLETYYGVDAAERITRMEVELLLSSYNPPLVLDNEVYFGAYFQSTANPPQIAGLEAQLEQTRVFNFGQRITLFDTPIDFTVQRSVNFELLRIGLDRNLTTGEITVYANNDQIGAPIPFTDAEDAILPVIYVKDGGVQVRVTRWTLTLR